MNPHPVMAIGNWRTNAELIADVARLGYLRKEWKTLDPTYGLGNFWTEWRPDELIGCDLNIRKSPIGRSVDFRYLVDEFGTDQFDAVTFDPAYKYNGTSAHPSDASYGVDSSGVSWQQRDELILTGLAQCIGVLKRLGFLLVKCQDQVVSGRVHWQVQMIVNEAESLECRWVDMMHIPGYRPQPVGRSQKHARRNYSTLLVFKLEREVR